VLSYPPIHHRDVVEAIARNRQVDPSEGHHRGEWRSPRIALHFIHVNIALFCVFIPSIDLSLCHLGPTTCRRALWWVRTNLATSTTRTTSTCTPRTDGWFTRKMFTSTTTAARYRLSGTVGCTTTPTYRRPRPTIRSTVG